MSLLLHEYNEESTVFDDEAVLSAGEAHRRARFGCGELSASHTAQKRATAAANALKLTLLFSVGLGCSEYMIGKAAVRWRHSSTIMNIVSLALAGAILGHCFSSLRPRPTSITHINVECIVL